MQNRILHLDALCQIWNITDAADLLPFCYDRDAARRAYDLRALPSGYGRVSDRICFKSVDEDGNEKIGAPICSWFAVNVRTRDEDSNGWGREIAFCTPDGCEKTVIVPDDTIHSPTELRKALAAAGMWIGTNKFQQEAFAELVNTYDTQSRAITVAKPGFYGEGANMLFVTPLNEVIRPHMSGDGVNYRLRSGAGAKDQEKGGTLESWRSEVSDKLWHEQTPHWALGLFSGVAGTILALAGEDSAGLGFLGPTTGGKTTAQYAGAGCWTPVDPKRGGLVINGRNTENTFEYRLERGNATSIHWDDTRTAANKKMFATLAFTLQSGSGRGRLNKNLMEQRTPTWTTYATISSEKSLRQLIEESGETYEAGNAVRIVTVDVASLDLIDDMEAKAIKEAMKLNHGHAGPVFVRELFSQGYHLQPERLRQRIDEYQQKLTADNNGAVAARAARNFATLWTAGAIMKEAGLLPEHADVERVIRWAWQSYQTTGEFRATRVGGDNVETLLLWFQSNRSRIHKIGEAAHSYQETVAWHDLDKIYLPKNNFSKIPVLTTGAGAVLKELKERDLLIPESRQNNVHKHIPQVGPIPHYRIKLEFDPIERKAAATDEAQERGAAFRDAVKILAGGKP